MSKECSKSIARRLHDPGFLGRYFVGEGIDVGGKPDPLALYTPLFPLLRSVRTWDLEDGDAQRLDGVADSSVDFVHASHCLEHLHDPREALCNWLRVVRPGGYVVVTVPDEDMYEQGRFPSTFNRDHKWTFTIMKSRSWSPRSVNVLQLLGSLGEDADVLRVVRLDATFRPDLPRYDQSITPVAECGIEFVVRRRTESELREGGRLPPASADVPREVRIHLNQYRDDRATLRQANVDRPPFANDAPL